MSPNFSEKLDISFAVPFVHKVRFTDDVLDRESNVLAELLESSTGPARVQFWIDKHVARAQPDLKKRIRALVARHADRMELAGKLQIVPGGEVVKNDVHLLERMLKVIHAANLDRRSYMVVIGGGAVLDAVGFAAAVAHRGIRLVRIPTTTLAQADSGVGVKNSVNLFHKKNWIGTFAVPWAVINDAGLLETLPDRDFICGFSEAVKVSLLKDPVLFDEICRLATRINLRDMSAALPVIRSSVTWHINHITRGGDPFEMLEARPLDFGHWSAHKLETMSMFQLRHGEAVAIGLAIDVVYSSLAHGLSPSTAERVLCCLQDLGFKLVHPVLRKTKALLQGMEEFRQHLGGELTLTMLEDVGRPIDVHRVDSSLMLQAIETVFDRFGREEGRRENLPEPRDVPRVAEAPHFAEN